MEEVRENTIPSVEEPEESLLFKGITIYVEIFNNEIDNSDLLDDILRENGANLIKKLSTPKIDYIVFKEGKDKTVEFALKNGISLVNPLWVHESLMDDEVKAEGKYIVKKTFSELSVNQSHKFGKRRTFPVMENDVILENTKKFKQSTQNYENCFKINNLQQTKKETIQSTLKEEEIENCNNKPNNKITNFFLKKTSEKDNIVNITQKQNITLLKNEHQPSIKLAGIDINEMLKFKINSCLKELGKYDYIGDSFESLQLAEYVVMNETSLKKNDFKVILCILNKKKIISIKYFSDSLKDKEYSLIDNYKISLLSFENEITKGVDKIESSSLKVFLHPSLYAINELKKNLIIEIIKISKLCEIVDNIRLCEICLINKEDGKEHYPGHVKLINQNFIFDLFYSSDPLSFKKNLDFNNIKYLPEKINIKK
jgi:hypothetical protein